MKLEAYIKKLTRKKKLLIIDNPNLLLEELDNDFYMVGKNSI